MYDQSPSSRTVHQILSANNLPVHENKQMSFCSACPVGKSHKLPFVHSHSMLSSPLDLIYSDVWGPAPLTSSNGYQFYVSFIDDFSKRTLFVPMSHKSKVLSIL